MLDQRLAQYVEAIPGTPLPFGLFSAATIIPVSDLHELNGVTWEPLSCAEVQTTSWCDEDPDFDYEKFFERNGSLYAGPVAAYYGRNCPPIGITPAEDETRARAGLAIGEQAALEGWVWANLLVPSATDLTPITGAVAPSVGVGLLEGALAEEYRGVGVLHSPAAGSSALARDYQFYRDGARMITWLGHNVSLGAGYPNQPAADTQLMISAPITIRREDVSVPGGGGKVDVLVNDRYILAERVSVISLECDTVFSVSVDLSAGSGGGSDDNDLELES